MHALAVCYSPPVSSTGFQTILVSITYYGIFLAGDDSSIPIYHPLENFLFYITQTNSIRKKGKKTLKTLAYKSCLCTGFFFFFLSANGIITLAIIDF